MIWSAVGSALNALGSGTDTKNKINQEYTQNLNNAHANYTASINGREQYIANTRDQRDMLDWQSDQAMDATRTNTALSMFNRNYQIQNEQARYDAFTAEFGDMQDNVFDYFRNLSATDKQAQNSDNIQLALTREMESLQQSFAERGISPTSGMYTASQAQLRMQAAINEVKMNRNVVGEVAQQQQNFANSQAQNQFLTRPEDFNSGMLNQEQLDGLITDSQRGQRDNARAGSYTPNTWDIEEAQVDKANRAKFLGIF